MKTVPSHFRGRLCLTLCPALLAAVALLLAPVSSLAATTDTWTGGSSPDGNWQNAANWGGTAPVAKDFLVFDGTTQLLATNDFAANTIFGNLSFSPTAGSFSLYGNSLILTNGSDAGSGATLGGGITNSSSSSQILALPITFSAGRHIITTDPGGGQLNLNGTITRNTGAGLAFVKNGSDINVTGSGLINLNGILGGGAVFSSGFALSDWAALDVTSNVVAYSTYTDVSGGAIANNASSNVRLTGDTAAFTAANGTTVNSVLSQITGAARNLTVTGVLRLGAKGGIFANSSASQTLTVTGGSLTTAGSGGELSFLSVPGATTARLTITSTITNDTGNAPVSVNAQGYMTFNGANTFSGGLFIYNNGRITTGNGLCLGIGPVTIYPNGEVFFNNNATFTNSFDIAGVGTTESNGGITGPGAYRVASTAVISGKTTFHGNARISTSATGGAITGQIVGDGQLELITFANDNSILLLSNSNNAANTWPSGTLINSLANTRKVTIRLGANEQIPDGPSAGPLILNGVDIAKLDLNGRNETVNGLIATNANSSNGQITNAGAAPSTLTLGASDATAAYNGSIKDSGFSTNALSIVKTGAGAQTLSGANAYVGSTTVNAGSLVFGAGSTLAGTTKLVVNSNATLDVSSLVPLNLGTNSVTSSNGTFAVSLVSGGNCITTPTLGSLGATNFITVTGIPAISTYPAQFVVIKATNNVVGTLNFGLGGPLPPSPGTAFAGYVSNNVANNSVDVVITAGPTSIKWSGYDGIGLNSSWDTVTTDWKTFGGALTSYSDGSFATFDDSASNAIVSLNQSVSPAGITINNSALSYNLNGGGGIGGGGGLIKQGSGTFILDNTGGNTFTGDININAGTLQLGNNDSGGATPTGVSIVNNGALVLAQNSTFTIFNIISGSGSLAENGNASAMINLSGANTFTGPVTISQGTLQTGNNLALGTTNAGTTVSSGATLDITANAINLGQEVITVSGGGVGGQGALINSAQPAGFVGPNMARVIMVGNTVVGGTGRFDLRSATTGNPTLGSLSTGGNPFKITKVGSGTFGLIGITVDPQLGDIEIQQGVFSTEAAMTTLGRSASNVIVYPSATFQMFAVTNQINKVFTIGGDGSSTNVSATSGANTIIGPMAITNDVIFNVNNAAVTLTLNNVITGPGTITKVGAGLLTFAGNSPAYAGGLQLNAGNITLSGTLSNGLGVNVANGKFTLNGTLLGTAGLTNNFISSIAGSGTSGGPADVAANLFPGDTNVIGTLTLGGLIVESSASIYFDLAFATNSGGAFNDLINVNGDLILNGGTITINPLALLRKAPNYSYRLINYSGALVTNQIPVVVAPQNYTATLDFSTTNQVNITFIGGPAVWDGGSASDSNWSDSANWGGVAINPGNSLFFDGTTRVSNNNDTSPGTTYQDLAFNTDAGAFTLNGNDITLSGNVINNSTNTQRVLFPMSSSAANNTFNGGTNGPGSKLIIGAGWTNTSSGVTSNTLAGVGTITNLFFTPNSGSNTFELLDTNANWTLVDNASSAPMTLPLQLDMQQGTFSFGQGASAPVLTNTSLVNSRLGVLTNGPATFNMANGTLAIAARLNTGTAAGSVGILNQTGGTLDLQSLFQISDGAAGASSTVNLSSGILNVGTPTAASIFLCSRGTGVFNVTLTGEVRCGTFDVSRNIGTTVGKVNLDGGTMLVNRVGTATGSANATQNGSVAIFNFNGGILRARQDNTTFFQGSTASPALPITTLVKSGGAIIDSSTFDISVLEPMQHDTNSAAPATDGGLIKNGSGNLTLSAGNTYTGPTAVNNGTLTVNGSVGTNTLTVATNAILAGTGTINGPVTINGGGAVSPAGTGVTGTLTVSNNVTFLPNGKAIMQVSKSPVANDLLTARNTNATTITFNGTLTVTNLAGTLANGDSFKLFSATNYSGTFASIQPAQPAIGLKWDTSQLYSAGILKIGAVSQPGITNVALSGSNIVIGGTNGTAGLSYRVLTSPDVTVPTSSWSILGTNTFNGSGNFQFSIGTTNAQQFFRLQAL